MAFDTRPQGREAVLALGFPDLGNKRRKIYWELSKVIYVNVEDAWLWYPMNIKAIRKNVCGYNDKLHDLGLEGFYHSHRVWLKGGKEYLARQSAITSQPCVASRLVTAAY